ncbi:MAG: phosphoenolpyruvate--protein phosphotransferase [Acidobacteria bacterium]|nr:phosphoenolpyruvate--protein phosphotransferase [Acidobacteriota bacterium]
MERLTGIGVSPGVAVGRAVVLTQPSEVVCFPIPPERVDRELAAIAHAVEQSRRQLQDIRARLASGPARDMAPLFDAQLLMLDDPLLVGRARQIVGDERVNAAWAVHRAYEEVRQHFAAMEDPYLRERETDLADVAGRLRMNLRHRGVGLRELLREIDGPSILVADELTASLAAQLDWTRVLGFATDAGSRTYHTAILARSLKVPAVVGLHDLSSRIAAGTPIILDGSTGDVTVDPDAAAIDTARHRAARPRRSVSTPAPVQTPVSTADGVRIRIDANIELVEDLPFLQEFGAEGIGLYRSEFLLSGRTLEGATEEVQYHAYRSLLEQVSPRPVTIRTFDLDERHTGLGRAPERSRARPGLRGLRLGLAHPEVLGTQLRALVRASAHGPLRIMFPFVTAVEEMRQARAIFESVCRGLGAAPVPLGAMIETPAAALVSDLLAREVDFFTIGTNDLIQYTLAVDRTDDRLSDLYEPLHPAVLRLIRMVGRAARRHGVPVSLCGEMASDPAMVGLLVGLGLTAFSMTPGAIPLVRRVIEDLRVSEVQRLARHALALATAAEVEQFLFDALAASARESSRR